VLEETAPPLPDHDRPPAAPHDPTSLPWFPPPGEPFPPPGEQVPSVDDHPVRVLVIQALAERGLDPRVDEDGDVGVVQDEQMLFVRCVDAQPPMARVFGQWLLETTGGDELTWLRAANAVTGGLNLVKATVHGDRLVIAIDLVLPPPGGPAPAADEPGLGELLTSALDAVLTAVQTWHETVNQLRSAAWPAGWPAE